MTSKSYLINRLHKKLGYLTVEDVEIAVDAILDTIKDNLIKQNRIEIRGFGSLSIRKRKRPGMDDFYNTVYFRMSKHVLDMLNPDLPKRDGRR